MYIYKCMYYVHSVFPNKCFQMINFSFYKETGPNMPTYSSCSKEGSQMHRKSKCNEISMNCTHSISLNHMD